MLGCIQPMSSPIMNRMLGFPAGVWADAGKFIAEGLIAASAVDISSPFIPLLTLMIQSSLAVFDYPGRASTTGHRLRPRYCRRRGFPYRSVYLPQVAWCELCGFGRNVDQTVLIDERRSVDDGISPKTVR